MNILLDGDDVVTMVIDKTKDNVSNQDNNYQIMDVELVRKASEGFGLTIIGKHQDSDVYICELVRREEKREN